MRPGARQRQWKHLTTKAGHPGMKQDYVVFRPTRSPTSPADTDDFHGLTRTTVQRLKNWLIRGHCE